jgi:hypothetical protein
MGLNSGPQKKLVWWACLQLVGIGRRIEIHSLQNMQHTT